MFAVRRTHVFLQNGTSARLAAPLIRMPAPEYAGRYKCLEERSLRRARFPALAGNPDGMEQETLRAPAASNRRGPQGKVTVESIVAGVFRETQARHQK
jgi:hypothetical protein